MGLARNVTALVAAALVAAYLSFADSVRCQTFHITCDEPHSPRAVVRPLLHRLCGGLLNHDLALDSADGVRRYMFIWNLRLP
jgi:hypothetical protein